MSGTSQGVSHYSFQWLEGCGGLEEGGWAEGRGRRTLSLPHSSFRGSTPPKDHLRHRLAICHISPLSPPPPLRSKPTRLLFHLHPRVLAIRNMALLWVWFWGETLSYPYLCTESSGFRGSPLAPQINLHFGDRATQSEGQVDRSLRCVRQPLEAISWVSTDLKYFVPLFLKE